MNTALSGWMVFSYPGDEARATKNLLIIRRLLPEGSQ
jgi:hypothetical protein